MTSDQILANLIKAFLTRCKDGNEIMDAIAEFLAQQAFGWSVLRLNGQQKNAISEHALLLYSGCLVIWEQKECPTANLLALFRDSIAELKNTAL
jgi:hypothetical protein